MARRIVNTTLNASTLDIMNVIRQNASKEYQDNVPEITKASEIPKVGEVIYGTPAFANQFVNALVNRIALVRTQSMTFNNPYAVLKKGYLEFGESIEDIFVSIATAVDYSAEKGAEREFKRSIPDVHSVFHAMNWRVMYPVTVQDQDLQRAFLSIDGVSELITRIVDSVYTASEVDEFLLFKYLLIKAISHGKMHSIGVSDGTNLKIDAKSFRGTSNLLQFPSKSYNEAGVKTTTPKDKQVIFMDANYNADFDVNVLASAFNMDKSDFMGRLFLIDNWTEFDNERFEIIRENSDGLEEVTSAELTAMSKVKAVLLNEDWFQVYDNNNKMTETYVGAGLYWNYFYHTWKTISYSPFAEAVVFVASDAVIALPSGFNVVVTDKAVSDIATVFTLGIDESVTLGRSDYEFIQDKVATENGIAIQKYGGVIIPTGKTSVTLKMTFGGASYVTATALTTENKVGDVIAFTKAV